MTALYNNDGPRLFDASCMPEAKSGNANQATTSADAAVNGVWKGVISTKREKIDLGTNFDEVLVLTTPAEGIMSPNFRQHRVGNFTISISGQPAIVHLVAFAAANKNCKVVSFRAERYAFANGHALSVQSNVKNQEDPSRTKKQVQEDINAFAKSLLLSTQIVHEIEKEKDADDKGETIGKHCNSVAQHEMVVEETCTEEQAVSGLGLEYAFLPTPDHVNIEAFEMVQEIMEIVLQAQEEGKAGLYFHCKKGVGRATNAGLIALLMLQAKTKSLKDILSDLEKGDPAISDFDSLDKDAKKAHIYSAEIKKLTKRSEFFGPFHRYCSEVSDYRKTTFEMWAKDNQITPEMLADSKKMTDAGIKVKKKDKT